MMGDKIRCVGQSGPDKVLVQCKHPSGRDWIGHHDGEKVEVELVHGVELDCEG